jgi:ERCC4-type nuclease
MIIIDTREPAEVKAQIRQHGIQIEEKNYVTTMDAATDYIINGRYAIERKAGTDLVGSIKDRKIYRQLDNLMQFDRPILLLENPQLRGFPVDSYNGFLASLIIKYPRLTILHSHNTYGTAYIITQIHEKDILPKTEIVDVNAMRPKSKFERPRDAQLFLLHGLLECSDVKARELLKCFKTPLNVFLAILNSKIEYTKNNKVKGISGPLSHLEGFGPKFLDLNQDLLKFDDSSIMTVESMSREPRIKTAEEILDEIKKYGDGD